MNFDRKKKKTKISKTIYTLPQCNTIINVKRLLIISHSTGVKKLTKSVK